MKESLTGPTTEGAQMKAELRLTGLKMMKAESRLMANKKLKKRL